MPDDIIEKLKAAKELVIIEGTHSKQIIDQTSFKAIDPVYKSTGFYLYSLDDKIVCFSSQSNFPKLPTPSTSCKVKMLSLQHLSSYKAHYNREATFIVRKLTSEKNEEDEKVANLETPNFITGFAADVGSACKLQDIPFTCYIAYISDLDEITMKNILQLLKNRLNVIENDSLKSNCLYNNSNLYI